MFQIPDGTTVMFDAAPNTGSTLKNWTGACSGTGSCEVTLGAAGATVGADFEPFYTLTIVMHPDATYPGASVTSTPSGISCTTGTCTHDFVKGTSVTLGGSVSMDWGYCNASKSCSVTMSSARTLQVYVGYAHVNIQVRDYTMLSAGYVDFSWGGSMEFNMGQAGGTYDKNNVSLGNKQITLDQTTGNSYLMFTNIPGCTSSCSFDLEDEIMGTINVYDN
jgi:hypothetical protein